MAFQRVAGWHYGGQWGGILEGSGVALWRGERFLQLLGPAGAADGRVGLQVQQLGGQLLALGQEPRLLLPLPPPPGSLWEGGGYHQYSTTETHC